jgi:excisionase family DNA binding protein
MTAVEVAQHLKIHPARVYKLAREGHIPAFKVGADFRFFKDAIEKLKTHQLGKAGVIEHIDCGCVAESSATPASVPTPN